MPSATLLAWNVLLTIVSDGHRPSSDIRNRPTTTLKTTAAERSYHTFHSTPNTLRLIKNNKIIRTRTDVIINKLDWCLLSLLNRPRRTDTSILHFDKSQSINKHKSCTFSWHIIASVLLYSVCLNVKGPLTKQVIISLIYVYDKMHLLYFFRISDDLNLLSFL